MGEQAPVDPRPEPEIRPSRRSFLQRTAAVAVPGVILAGAATVEAAPPAGIGATAHRGAPGRGRGSGRGRGPGGHPYPPGGTTPPPTIDLPELYPAQNARAFRDILQHEVEHAIFLFNALQSRGAAYPAPEFVNLVQPNVLTFAGVAQIFENLGVGAYLGALPLLDGTPFLKDAASIALIEARHAGYVNTLLNKPVTASPVLPDRPGPTSFEEPLAPEVVFAGITPFLANPAAVREMLFPVNTAIDALQFALALEYLEATFYTLNVPRFFGVA